MTRLFELRKERGLSQRDMAVEFNVSQSTYNNWENSNTQPAIEQLVALARFFEVSVDYLVGNSDYAGNITIKRPLSIETEHVLTLYSALSPKLKDACLTILEGLSSL